VFSETILVGICRKQTAYNTRYRLSGAATKMRRSLGSTIFSRKLKESVQKIGQGVDDTTVANDCNQLKKMALICL